MDLKAWLQRSPLIAILRGVQPEEVESIGAALQETGIGIVEVPLNSPRPLESIARLARRFGDEMLIGAGTLTEPSQVAQVAAAGGENCRYSSCGYSGCKCGEGGWADCSAWLLQSDGGV